MPKNSPWGRVNANVIYKEVEGSRKGKVIRGVNYVLVKNNNKILGRMFVDELGFLETDEAGFMITENAAKRYLSYAAIKLAQKYSDNNSGELYYCFKKNETLTIFVAEMLIYYGYKLLQAHAVKISKIDSEYYNQKIKECNNIASDINEINDTVNCLNNFLKQQYYTEYTNDSSFIYYPGKKTRENTKKRLFAVY